MAILRWVERNSLPVSAWEDPEKVNQVLRAIDTRLDGRQAAAWSRKRNHRILGDSRTAPDSALDHQEGFRGFAVSSVTTLTSKKPSRTGGRRLAPPAGLEPAAKRLEGAWCVGCHSAADLRLFRRCVSRRSAFDTHSTSTGGRGMASDG
ncbi:hypothetical protein GCM10010303_24070 [Streptomyces purpurascens]|nr:hypothetical protein GCM10010303_24070 [Streptomyces purpurascens]